CSTLGVALVNLIVLHLFTISLIFLVGVSCANTDSEFFFSLSLFLVAVLFDFVGNLNYRFELMLEALIELCCFVRLFFQGVLFGYMMNMVNLRSLVIYLNSLSMMKSDLPNIQSCLLKWRTWAC
ncbi:hypothetical protein Tsubulata_019103, partial [Turnera subulata]